MLELGYPGGPIVDRLAAAAIPGISVAAIVTQG